MACFDNVVGLRTLCSDLSPDYYLEDIGINKTELEQVITKDFNGVQDFIDKKSAFAVIKVTNEIYNYLKPFRFIKNDTLRTQTSRNRPNAEDSG